MSIEIPKHWRKGQTIFNFMRWLDTEGWAKCQGVPDTYYMQDSDFDKLYSRFLKKYYKP